jgi:hypothetical protein
MRWTQSGTLAAAAVLWSGAVFAQVVNIDQPAVNLSGGPVSINASFDLPVRPGPAQNITSQATGLAFFTASYYYWVIKYIESITSRWSYPSENPIE